MSLHSAPDLLPWIETPKRNGRGLFIRDSFLALSYFSGPLLLRSQQVVRSEVIRYQHVDELTLECPTDSTQLLFSASDAHGSFHPSQLVEIHTDHPLVEWR